MEGGTQRRLVLHFNLPQTLLVGDPDGKGNAEERILTTEFVLAKAIASQAWGVIEDEEFVLTHPDVQMQRPADDMFCYTEFLALKFPIEGQSKFSQDENRQIQERAILEFTDKTGPGAKLKAFLDQMVKTLALPKPLAKALSLPNNPILDENASEDVKFNADKGLAFNLTRYGRYILVPAFWTLLQTLTKAKREFLGTQRPGEEFPLMFEPTVLKKAAQIYSGLTHRVCTESGCAAVLHDHEFWASDRKTGGKLYYVDLGDVEDVQQIFFDGTIAYPTPSSAAVGLSSPAPPGVSSGSITSTSSLRMQDVVSGDSLDPALYDEVFVHQIRDVRQVLLNPNYFVEAVDACEKAFEAYVAKTRTKKTGGSDPLGLGLDLDLGVGSGGAVGDAALMKKLLAGKGSKDYLYATVMPVLMGGLEQVAKFRPEDPCEFLAFYLMRHCDGYNKTLRLED